MEALSIFFIVSAVFGLSQGGIVPSYALVVRQFLPAQEAGSRIGIVLMLTIFGMAIGGWMSGYIFDLTGSYKLSFFNGILWNMLNLCILAWLFFKLRKTSLTPKLSLKTILSYVLPIEHHVSV